LAPEHEIDPLGLVLQRTPKPDLVGAVPPGAVGLGRDADLVEVVDGQVLDAAAKPVEGERLAGRA